MTSGKPSADAAPLSRADWLRALPWLALLELLFFLPYLFKNGGAAAKYIWDEHCVAHTYPLAWLAREQVLAGRFPLWNPFSGTGLPLLANTLDETALPYAILKYALPFPAGLNAFIAFKMALALAGAFALGRSANGSRQGSLVCAAVYSFTGFIALNVNSVIGSAFVLPWCVFGMHRLAKKPGAGPFAITAMAFGLSLMGGNPQIPFQALLIGYALYLLVLFNGGGKVGLGRAVLLPAAAVILGAAMAAPQLLPFGQYLSLAFSHHLPGYGELHLDPRGVAGVASPLWDPAIVNMGGRAIGDSLDHWLSMRFPPPSQREAVIPLPFEHIGTLAVFFLAAALIRLRRLPVEAAFFAAMAIFAVGQAFGLFPFWLLGKVPPFTQISNWRFTTFPAALGCAALGAIVWDRLFDPAEKRTRAAALAATALFVVAGAMALAANAGMPLSSPLLLGPALAAAALLAALALAIFLNKPGLAAALAVLELLAYDRIMDRNLFPHPLRYIEEPGAVAECAPSDRGYRFSGLGEVMHPSVGIMLGPLNDLRSYEMIFPRHTVDWFAEANGWSRRETVNYYLTHYYFALEEASFGKGHYDAASVEALLAGGYLPRDPALDKALQEAGVVAPAREYVNASPVELGGRVDDALFMHAPSRAVVESPFGSPERVAGRATISPAEAGADGDGPFLALFSRTSGGGRSKLLVARHFGPVNGITGAEAGDASGLGAAVGFTVMIEPGIWLEAVSLPGPRDDRRSDFGLWADIHRPGPRREFEKEWELTRAGATKCYRNKAVPPRLRIEGTESGGAAPGEVTEAEYGYDSARAVAELDGPGLLVFADAYYPGWKVFVDGREARVLRVRGAFRGVDLDRGRHEVRFAFIPESFRLGLWSGLLAWACFAVFVARQRRPGRRTWS